MKSQISELEKEAKEALLAIDSASKAESFRIAYLGKKGKLTELFKNLRDLPKEEKVIVGQDLNKLKTYIQGEFDQLNQSLGDSKSTKPSTGFDVTMPALVMPQGRVHLLQQTIDEIVSIFERIGFECVSGPEIETEFHNFQALNVSLDHPARDGFDTFYSTGGQLLRSQTSTVQIRTMESQKPPLRIVAPGRVYRPDTVDASHSFMFHQIEGLLVDESVTFADLKGVLNLFLKEFFGEKTKSRFRPHFFPFTEPSVEVDIEWGKKGWLEILGAGSVDPNVFKEVGYDPEKVQGFAFGMGVERIAMLKHGISDIRYFYENDLRFLRQF